MSRYGEWAAKGFPRSPSRRALEEKLQVWCPTCSRARRKNENSLAGEWICDHCTLAQELTASVAREETRKMPTKEEIEQLLRDNRAKLEERLKNSIERREQANKEIAEVREELAKAPRLHVPRTKKPKFTQPDVKGVQATLAATDAFNEEQKERRRSEEFRGHALEAKLDALIDTAHPVKPL